MAPYLSTWTPSRADVDVMGTVFHGVWARVSETCREQMHGQKMLLNMLRMKSGWFVQNWCFKSTNVEVCIGTTVDLSTTVEQVGDEFSPVYATETIVRVRGELAATISCTVCFYSNGVPKTVPNEIKQRALRYSK